MLLKSLKGQNMIKFNRIIAALLALAMLFSLSACMSGEGSDTSFEISSEITEPFVEEDTLPEEETTAAPDGIYELGAMELLGMANKKILGEKSYTKNIGFKVDMGQLGVTEKSIKASIMGDDIVAESETDGELTSFCVRQGEFLLIMDNAFGVTGYYSIDKVNKEEFEEIFSVCEIGGGILDINKSENFKNGEIVSSKNGFIVSLELSEKGKNLLIGDFEEEDGVTYDIKNQSIVATISEDGTLQDLTIDMTMSMSMSGVTVDFTVELDFSISDIGKDIAYKEPVGVNIVKFEEYARFSDYIVRAVNFQVLYTMLYDHSFENQCTVELTNKKNNTTRKIIQKTSGKYKLGEGIDFICNQEESGKKTTEEYYYRNGSSVVWFTDGNVQYTASEDMTPEFIAESFRATLFSTYAGAYDSNGSVRYEKKAFNSVYFLQITEEYARDKIARVLTLMDIELPEDAKIEFLRAENALAGVEKSNVFDGSDIYIEANVSFGDQSYLVKISDFMFMFYTAPTLKTLPDNLK
jgi:hypothetical protein